MVREEVVTVMVFARFERPRRSLFSLPPNETTGPPADDHDELASQSERMGFIERRIDAISRRIEVLEAIVKQDQIAPLGPQRANGERR